MRRENIDIFYRQSRENASSNSYEHFKNDSLADYRKIVFGATQFSLLSPQIAPFAPVC